MYPEYFLPGTLPKTTCDVCSQMKNQRQQGLSNFSSDLGIFGDMDFSGSSLNVDEDLLLDEGSLFDDDGGYDFEDEEVQLLTPDTEQEDVFAEPEKKENEKEQVEEVKTVVSSHEPEETVTEKVIEVPAEKPDEVSEQSENDNATDSSSENKEEKLSDVTSDS